MAARTFLRAGGLNATMALQHIPVSLRMFAAIALVAVASAVGGCASAGKPLGTYHDNKYSVEDIVKMVHDGEPTDQILNKLAAASGFYPIPASELIKLHAQGVPPEILDYMQATWVRTVRNEERYQIPQRFNSTY